MPHDPVLVDETKSWLRKASQDLYAAKVLLSGKDPMAEACVFHCQQAVEKALKGFLTWNQQSFRKTHSIEEIGEQCIHLDKTLSALIESSVHMTEYAWKYRYPGDYEEPSEDETKEALDTAEKVFREICAKLPKECRP